MQMSALAKRVVQEPVIQEPVVYDRVAKETAKSDDVLIHVRFHPNADIASMAGECPEHISPKDWYTLLHKEAPGCYQAFAGGRGFFRIPRSTFNAIVSKL
jgi:hypothetical protein